VKAYLGLSEAATLSGSFPRATLGRISLRIFFFSDITSGSHACLVYFETRRIPTVGHAAKLDGWCVASI
jgi:hypothetical protein